MLLSMYFSEIPRTDLINKPGSKYENWSARQINVDKIELKYFKSVF